MKRGSIAFASAVALSLGCAMLSSSASAWAGQAGGVGADAGGATANAIDPRAIAVLQTMTGFLAAVKTFSVTADIDFDAVQDEGQKLEFGETRSILVDRPGRLRIDTTKRSGETSRLIFDGKQISLSTAKPNVYAIEDAPGTIDSAVTHLVKDLDTRLPLAELLSAQRTLGLRSEVLGAVYVEPSTIEEVACDHIYLHGRNADLQLWVAQGKKPLPQRMVITYIRQDGRPEFRVRFRDWDLSPGAGASRFAFTPAKGAKRIRFAASALSPAAKVQSK
jgi:hypothetical protein